MISRYEVGRIIDEEFDEQLHPNTICLNIDLSFDLYRSINDLTRIAVHAANEHELQLLKKCFSLAEKLYNQGEYLVRSAIENVFVYAITNMLPSDHAERVLYQSIIPKPFAAIYLRQIMTDKP